MVNPLIEIFAPYLPFITFTVTIALNIWFIFLRLDWIKLIILNVIVIILFNVAGLGGYNFINVILGYIVDILIELVNGVMGSVGQMWDNFWQPIVDFLDNILPW